jgi:hypothetical protein
MEAFKNAFKMLTTLREIATFETFFSWHDNIKIVLKKTNM